MIQFNNIFFILLIYPSYSFILNNKTEILNNYIDNNNYNNHEIIFDLNKNNIICNNIGDENKRKIFSLPCDNFYKGINMSYKYEGKIICKIIINGNNYKKEWLCSPSKTQIVHITMNIIKNKENLILIANASESNNIITIQDIIILIIYISIFLYICNGCQYIDSNKVFILISDLGLLIIIIDFFINIYNNMPFGNIIVEF